MHKYARHSVSYRPTRPYYCMCIVTGHLEVRYMVYGTYMYMYMHACVNRYRCGRCGMAGRPALVQAQKDVLYLQSMIQGRAASQDEREIPEVDNKGEKYRSQVTWEIHASSKVVSHTGVGIARGCRMHPLRTYARARACARTSAQRVRVHVHVRRWGPNIVPSAKTWQDRDNTVGELTRVFDEF